MVENVLGHHDRYLLQHFVTYGVTSQVSHMAQCWITMSVICYNTSFWGSQDSLLVRVPQAQSKGCEFESWQEWWVNFPLELTLCADSYSVSILPLCYRNGT